MSTYYNPKIEGKINIFPSILDGNIAKVTIIGDPKGLNSLAKLLQWLADFDQNKNYDPVGEREHIHLHANEPLGWHSCEVEVCRADAKGTGELPDYMK